MTPSEAHDPSGPIVYQGVPIVFEDEEGDTEGASQALGRHGGQTAEGV